MPLLQVCSTPVLLPFGMYEDNWVGEHALNMLKQRPPGKPWFMQVVCKDGWEVGEYRNIYMYICTYIITSVSAGSAGMRLLIGVGAARLTWSQLCIYLSISTLSSPLPLPSLIPTPRPHSHFLLTRVPFSVGFCNR